MTDNKIFVIDTNVFIHKPDAILSFKDNEVVVPLWVLEELDKLKTFSDEKGRNARHAIRFLENQSRNGSLHEGVKMENGSVLRVLSLTPDHLPDDLRHDRADNKIIYTALALQLQGNTVFFVSKDINARVKAKALGLKAVDYEKQKVSIDNLYPGIRTHDIAGEKLDAFIDEEEMEWPDQLTPNEYLLLHDRERDVSALGRFDAEEERIFYIRDKIRAVCGIHPRNEQQRAAFDLLLDDRISLVTLVGKAGTGKTLLALAAGLRLTVEDEFYKRLLVTRPVVPLGKDIGYLPGDKEQKLSHWMEPLFDNLEYILSVNKKATFPDAEMLINTKILQIEALTYIRGRSLPGQYIIVDEAQNLSPHEIKTIVSRAGQGTKVVLTGDPYQIDSPYLDSESNGLTYLVEAFKGQPEFGHVILDKSERSRLAELAAELL